MNWYGNYTRRFRVYALDERSWGDLAEIGRVDSLDIANDAESDCVQDGSMTVFGEQPNGWVRVYLEADGDGEQERVPVATMRATTHERTIVGTTYSATADMDSVLFDASSTELPVGYFAPKGADPVRFASSMLAQFCKCPVEIGQSDLSLKHTVVAEQNDSVMTFVAAVLDGTGWRVAVDGRGVVSLSESGETASLDGSRIYADGVTDKVEDGVRTVTYTRPYDPSITIGSKVSLYVPEHGIVGIFEVRLQRLTDDCAVQEVVFHGVA